MLLLVRLAVGLTICRHLVVAIVLLRTLERIGVCVVVITCGFVVEFVVTIVLIVLLLLLPLRIISLLILFAFLGLVLLSLRLLWLILLYLTASIWMVELLRIAVEAVEIRIVSVVLATFFASTHVVVWPSASHVVHLLVAHIAATTLLTLRVAHLALTSLAEVHALIVAAL